MIVGYVRYNASTGAVTCYGTCAQTDLALQPQSGEGVLALSSGTVPAQVASVNVAVTPHVAVMKT